MTDRYTRKDAEAAFNRLRLVLDKPNGHYREAPTTHEENPFGAPKYVTIPGGWALDHNSWYGGYVIQEIDPNGGTGIFEPFGSRRRTAREFCDAVNFALSAISLAQTWTLSEPRPAFTLT